MIPYNSKFWTVPPEKLSCEWLEGFIPVPSLSQVIEGSIEDSRREFGYNAHFWYPRKGGIKQVALALSGELRNIETDCEVTKIDIKHRKIRLNNGNEEEFDCLISTLPLPEAGILADGIPMRVRRHFELLRWNSVFNLGFENDDNLFRHWVYFPEKELSFFSRGFSAQFLRISSA